MSKTQVIVTKSNKTETIVKAFGKGQPVVLKAEHGARYELEDLAKAKKGAIDGAKFKRVGKSLHIVLDNEDTASLVIEDYYSVYPDGVNAVVGQAENGALYEYVTPSGSVSGLQADTTAVAAALGTQAVSAPAAVGSAGGNYGGTAALLGALGAGAAAASGKKDAGATDLMIKGQVNAGPVHAGNGPVSTSGQLIVQDIDSADVPAFVVDKYVGDFGELSVSASGAWTYTTTAELNPWNAYDHQPDSFNVILEDGSQQEVTITIHGSDDPSTTTGDVSAKLWESETGVTLSGELVNKDWDSPVGLDSQTTQGQYGFFTLIAPLSSEIANWTYTLDAAHENLAAGAELIDTFTVLALDGQEQQVTITIKGQNDGPVLSVGSSVVYAMGDAAQAINSVIAVADVDSATMASATVSISAGFSAGEDVLSFDNVDSTAMGNIVGSYVGTTGVMTLTSEGGTATQAQWQAALRAVAYSNVATTPAITARTISYVINDGHDNSTPLTSTVQVQAGPDQTVSFSSMTKDSGVSGSNADWLTHDSSAGRLVSGTVSAPLAEGESLKVYANGMEVGNAVVSGTNWQITDTTGYSANWTYTAKVVNLQSISGPVASQVVTADFVEAAPVITAVTDAATATIANNGTTLKSLSTVSGTGVTGNTVYLYDNTGTNLVGTATVVNGAWTIPLGGQGDVAAGSNVFSAVQMDPSGNTSVQSNLWTVNAGGANMVPNGDLNNNANFTSSLSLLDSLVTPFSGVGPAGYYLISAPAAPAGSTVQPLTTSATSAGTAVNGSGLSWSTKTLTILRDANLSAQDRDNYAATKSSVFGYDAADTSMAVTVRGDQNLGLVTVYQVPVNSIQVEAGKTYQFSFNYEVNPWRTQTLTAVVDGVEMKVTGYEGPLNYFTTGTMNATYTATETKYIDIRFLVNNNGAVGGAGGELWLDDISFQVKTTAANGSLAENTVLFGTSGGASDVSYSGGLLNAQGGNDVITVTATDLKSQLLAGGVIQGGEGYDTLVLAAGTILNMADLRNTQTVKYIDQIEALSLTGNSSLTLNANDVLSLGGEVVNGKVRLVINKTGTDLVTLENLVLNPGHEGVWVSSGNTLIDGHTYEVLDHSTTQAQVLIQIGPDQTVSFSSMTKDSGVLGSNADWLTNDGSAGRLVSGTVSAPLQVGQTLKVYANGVEIGNAVVSGTNWQITDTTGYSANWTYTAKVVNLQSISGPVASQVVTVDFVEAAPVITAVTDAATASIANNGTTLKSLSTVSGTGVTGDTVYLYDNSGTNLVGTATVVNGVWSIPLGGQGNVAAGSNAFSAVQMDTLGNTSVLSNVWTVNAGGANMVLNGDFNSNNFTTSLTYQPTGIDYVATAFTLESRPAPTGPAHSLARTGGGIANTAGGSSIKWGVDSYQLDPLLPAATFWDTAKTLLGVDQMMSGSVNGASGLVTVYQSQSFTVEAGKTYQLGLNYQSDDWAKQVLTVIVDGVSMPLTVRLGLGQTTNTTGTLTATYTAAESKTIDIKITADNTGNNGNGGDFNLDDVSFKVATTPADGTLVTAAKMGGSSGGGSLSYSGGLLNAQGGNDVITVTGTDLKSQLLSGGFIDGGDGYDTLVLAAGTSLNLADVRGTQTVKYIQHIEALSLTGNSSLTFNANDVWSLGGEVVNGKVRLVIHKTGTDLVTLENLVLNPGHEGVWVSSGTTTLNGYAYNVLNHSTTQAQVLIQTNTAPVLSTSSTLAYTENDAPKAINSAITVADVDNATLASATVSITGGYVAGQDVLSFTPVSMGNIVGSYANGVMTLTSAGGTATKAQWQAALEAVAYSNTSDAPSTAPRTVSYVINDGTVDSAVLTSTIDVTAVNDVPTGSVVITGAPASGATLTATHSLADLDGLGTVTYTWYANGTAIPAAVGNTYVLTASDADKAITVKASYTDLGGTQELVSSASVSYKGYGQAVVDMGAGNGKLIAPMQVEGKWYYYWDRSGDGNAVGADDAVSHDTLDTIFKYDINGNLNPQAAGGTSNIYRYATINGVQVALPTVNGGLTFASNTVQSATAVVGTSTTNNNPRYDEMLAVWDASNGSTVTTASVSGVPTGWMSVGYGYWTATETVTNLTGHYYVMMNSGGKVMLDQVDANKLMAALEVVQANSAPVLNVAASPVLSSVQVAALPPTNGDTTAGNLVSDLVGLNGSGLANVTDSDAGAVTGMAITGVQSGTVWFSTNGGVTWQSAVGLSDAKALRLAPTDRVFYQPDGTGAVGGTLADAITFRAWDQSYGGSGTYENTAANGGKAQFSSATDMVAVSFTSPELVGTTLDLGVVNGMHLRLIGKVDANGKTYYHVDKNMSTTADAADYQGTTHDVLDTLFNGGADTTGLTNPVAGEDTERSLIINGYTVILPTITELQALRTAMGGVKPVGWDDYFYWSSTSSGANAHRYMQFSNGTPTAGTDTSTGNFAVQVLRNAVGPVVMDLNGDGTLSYSQVVMDVNSDGRLDKTAWAGAQDGVLVWDKNGDGVVRDASQYAFTQYGGQTDLQGLAAGFDSNGDGVLDAADAKFAEFAVWQDANQNGVSDAGEVRSLAAVGVTSIDLRSDGVTNSPAEGVTEAGRTTAIMADGSKDGTSMLVADAAFDFSALSYRVNAEGDLSLLGEQMNLDLSSLVSVHGALHSVDLTGTGANSLKISLSDLLSLGEQQPLRVLGDADDSVVLDATQWAASGTAQSEGHSYAVYAAGSGQQLWLEQHIHMA